MSRRRHTAGGANSPYSREVPESAPQSPSSSLTCLYKRGRCKNPRAIKKNGKPHTLCEYHRQKQITYQRNFEQKVRLAQERQLGSGSDSEQIALDLSPPASSVPATSSDEGDPNLNIFQLSEGPPIGSPHFQAQSMHQTLLPHHLFRNLRSAESPTFQFLEQLFQTNNSALHAPSRESNPISDSGLDPSVFNPNQALISWEERSLEGSSTEMTISDDVLCDAIGILCDDDDDHGEDEHKFDLHFPSR